MALFHLTVTSGNSRNEEIYLKIFFKLQFVFVTTHGVAEFAYLSRPIALRYDQQLFINIYA